MELKEKILSVINEDEVVNLTRELIRIPSHCQTPGGETEVAEFIFNWLKKEGIEDLELKPVIDGRPNVIARIKGTGGGPSLMLNGHMDTVPPYDMIIEPFNPVIKDGRIYGRGTCDMKGPLASMMMAMAAIKRADVTLKGDLIFTAVINEEMRSEGTEDIILSGLKADGAIVGEPTNLQIAAGHRGLEWLEVVIYGKAAHGGNPEKGINAISKAADFIKEVENNLIPQLKTRAHPLVGEPILNFGVIHGGDQPSTVAPKCIIQIDRRWTPNETLEQVFQDFYDIFEKLSQKDPQFKAELKRIPTNMATMDHMPVTIDLKHSLVTTLRGVIEEVTGNPPQVGALGGWTDASLLYNFGKIPALNFGPGSMEQAHTVDEYIEIDQLLPAAVIYAITAARFNN
jgi:acetylornithine deacetylase/succinyl-diaminopimelate desuccinylase